MNSKKKFFFDFGHKKIICESSKPKKPNVNHMRLWHHGNHKESEQHDQNYSKPSNHHELKSQNAMPELHETYRPDNNGDDLWDSLPESNGNFWNYWNHKPHLHQNNKLESSENENFKPNHKENDTWFEWNRGKAGQSGHNEHHESHSNRHHHGHYEHHEHHKQKEPKTKTTIIKRNKE
jgi:hypothetical protein